MTTSEDERCRLIVAGTNCPDIANLLPLARTLAPARGERKLILGLVTVPAETPLSNGARAAQELRLELEPLPQLSDTQIQVRVTHSPWRELKNVMKSTPCGLMLANWTGGLEEVLRELPSDVVMVKGTMPRKLERILLPIRGGPYAALSLQLAVALAHEHNAEITLLHAAPPVRFRDELFREFFAHLHEIPEITRWIKVRGDAIPAILENARADQHQLMIMGAIARPQPGHSLVGRIASRVLEGIDIPALIVKTRPTLAEEMDESPEPRRVDYTISVVVDKWFAENTFHAHEFQDLKRLVEKKQRQGLSISLGLPALNEEATIGKVIKTVRRAFMQQYPLLDEIVVIDSNSSDKTVEIAQDLGVPVFKHPEILAQYGSFAGKGEALWNSLYVLNGDLIAWIDTDIVNIHPRFVYGILGPLIQEPRLMYVKGFYQRPLRVGKKLQAKGGGRVTELLARPLLNLFYPELSGMIQPLSGEYAGRREALESVPFYSGYGVETGLLIDILGKYGLSAIGQVDLEERVHRNQSIFNLSKMAFAILQVVMQRIEESRKSELVDWMNSSLKLIRNEGEDYHIEVFEIRDHQRPPMITIPEYLEKRTKRD